MIIALSFPGGWELVLVFLVVLLLFGAKRIPEIARGLGRGIREFKDATDDVKKELTLSNPPQQVQPPPPTQQPTEATTPPAQQAPPQEGQAS